MSEGGGWFSTKEPFFLSFCFLYSSVMCDLIREPMVSTEEDVLCLDFLSSELPCSSANVESPSSMENWPEFLLLDEGLTGSKGREWVKEVLGLEA